MKELLSGNEAIARGAYEAGVSVATAYPGTPSTEILENIAKYELIHAQWSPNEKVALEVAAGASFSGARSLTAMKHVGVNVAADPLMTVSYTGVRGGMVIVTADDPSMHSSQNEQDNRQYARFAKIPMLEPADSQEAKDFVIKAFDISERYDTPVFLRTVTRMSHSKSIVSICDPSSKETSRTVELEKDPEKLVMLPEYARERRVLIEERMKQLSAFSESFDGNEMVIKDRSFGIISSGISWQYAKEVFPDASFLKLSMIFPLPIEKIRRFASEVERLYVFEELDPFIEEQVRAAGITTEGKSVFPVFGEFSPAAVKKGIYGEKEREVENTPAEYLPPRPPAMCPGCPYLGIFYTLKKMDVFVSGDIGCYTLGALPPFQCIDSTICMGASLGISMGIEKALGSEGAGKTVAVIGDSTFLHSGIPGLMDIVYNRGSGTVVILDNRSIAMTGRQDHPGTGYTIKGEQTKRIDCHSLCSALGVEHVETVNPYDLEQLETVLNEEISRPAPSVIISRAPCVLNRRGKKGVQLFTVKEDTCDSCRACLQIHCPAIEWHNSGKTGRANISPTLCSGCSLCAQVCGPGAIIRKRGQDG